MSKSFIKNGALGEHATQYTDDVLQNCTPEAYIILLTNVTPIHSIKKKKWCTALL